MRQRLLSSLPPTLRDLLSSASSSSSSATAASPATIPAVQVTAHGWIRSVRVHKNVSFAELDDGSGSTVQAVLKGGIGDGLTQGSAVKFTGRLENSRGRGQSLELVVDQIDILGSSDPDVYPIQKKSLPAPVLRDIAHLRFRTTQTAAVMRVRDALARSWHDWFEENEFVHIHTPILTSSDCEGAGETFTLATPQATPSLPIPSSSNSTPSLASTSPPTPPTPPSAPFFDRPINLTVSSQLHLEAPTASLTRCYTLSPCFRAEPSQTSRHLSEFYMLEAEVAFVDRLEGLLDVVEDGIREVVRGVVDGDTGRASRVREDLQRLAASGNMSGNGGEGSAVVGTTTNDGLEHLRTVANTPFARITYTAAIERLQTQHSIEPFEHEPKWGESISTEQEKWIAANVGGPVFVTHYPVGLKPFYMLPSDIELREDTDTLPSSLSSGSGAPGPTVACFDLLFPGIGEVAGGSMREHRLSHLESTLDNAGLGKEEYGWYLDLRRYGSTPHGGWGMGWERFVCWVTGVGNVRDVVAFPRWVGNCRY